MAENAAYADAIEVAIRESLDVKTLRSTVEAGIEAALRHPRFTFEGRLVFTGSGNSLFAAVATLPAIRRWCGLPAQVLTSIEFARYESPLLAPADIVLCVSNSGGSTRTRECLALAQARGNLVVGVTGSREGPLARRADVVVHHPVGPVGSAPPRYRRLLLHMIEYVAVLYSLYALGIGLGHRRGRLDSGEKARRLRALEEAIDAIVPTARRLERTAESIARSLADADTLWVIGAGPNQGTAEYCAAKFHEQVPMNGIAQDLEEWAHLQYFLTLHWRRRSAVVVLAPPGNSLDRAAEMVAGIATAGGRAFVVTHPECRQFGEAEARFEIDAVADELLTPLLYHLPTQLLTLYLSQRAGPRETPLRRQDDYWLIRKGVIRESLEELK